MSAIPYRAFYDYYSPPPPVSRSECAQRKLNLQAEKIREAMNTIKTIDALATGEVYTLFKCGVASVSEFALLM